MWNEIDNINNNNNNNDNNNNNNDNNDNNDNKQRDMGESWIVYWSNVSTIATAIFTYTEHIGLS